MAPTGWLVYCFSCCTNVTVIGDHWKIVFKFYMNWYENGYSSSILLRCATVHYPSTNDQYTLIPQSLFQISWGESGDMRPSSLQSTLNSLLWPRPNVIINTHNPMKNPGQTWIFYEPGQTQMTWPSFNPGLYLP